MVLMELTSPLRLKLKYTDTETRLHKFHTLKQTAAHYRLLYC